MSKKHYPTKIKCHFNSGKIYTWDEEKKEFRHPDFLDGIGYALFWHLHDHSGNNLVEVADPEFLMCKAVLDHWSAKFSAFDLCVVMNNL